MISDLDLLARAIANGAAFLVSKNHAGKFLVLVAIDGADAYCIFDGETTPEETARVIHACATRFEKPTDLPSPAVADPTPPATPPPTPSSP